jgi:orotidine-5'-phosphate decarboxylase
LGSLCAGIDPNVKMLERWGLPDSAEGARAFALAHLDALAGQVAIMKPNVAFFEQYGSAGLAALETFVSVARSAGVLTLLDAKRGDIASTNEAYARAWVTRDSPLAGDAVTVSPLLGIGALAPMIDAAEAHGRGVFIVVRTSNPEGREVQLSRRPDGRTLEATLLEDATRRGDAVGAVIGLRAGANPLSLPEDSFYLAPGVGSQGAGWADLTAQFAGMASTPVVVNLSRSLASAGPDPRALADTAARAQEQIARGLLLRTG